MRQILSLKEHNVLLDARTTSTQLKNKMSVRRSDESNTTRTCMIVTSFSPRGCANIRSAGFYAENAVSNLTEKVVETKIYYESF